MNGNKIQNYLQHWLFYIAISHFFKNIAEISTSEFEVFDQM